MRHFTLTSREINQDIGRAKKAAEFGPVFITDRGKPAHVLLTFGHYLRLARHKSNLAEALSMPGLSDIEFEPPATDIRSKAVDFD